MGGSSAFEALHLAFPSSGRLMRILRSIVAPSPAHVAFPDPEIARGSAIRAQIIGDDLIGNERVFLQQFPHQFKRSLPVQLRLDEHVENLALAVDGSPKIDKASVDLEIDLVEMPRGVRPGPALAQVRRNHRPEMVHPPPNGLV